MWLSAHFLFNPPQKPHYQGRVTCFVGGGSNIAIATDLYLRHFLYCIVNIRTVYRIDITNVLRFPVVSVSGCGDKLWLAPSCSGRLQNTLYTSPGTSVIWMWLRLGIIYCCALRDFCLRYASRAHSLLRKSSQNRTEDIKVPQVS